MEKYGHPSAKGFKKSGATGHYAVHAAWFDNKTFVGVESSDWGRSFEIFYAISNEGELESKLVELEKEGKKLKQFCLEEKKKAFNKIKTE